MLKLTKVFEKNAIAYKEKKHRYICNQGGTSSSKTFSILQLLTVIAMKYNKKIDIVGLSVPHLKTGVLNDMPAVLSQFGLNFHELYNKSDKFIEFPSGGTLNFIAFDNLGKAHGGRRDILYLNEANHLHYEIVEQLMIRTRDCIFIDFNPTNAFWVHKKLQVEETEKTLLSLPKIKDKFENEEALYEGLAIETYRPVFERLVQEEATIYVDNLNNAKTLLSNLNYKYLSGDAAMFDIDSFAAEAKLVVKALANCNTILELESDDLIDVYGDVITTDIEQIKTSIALRAHQDELLTKYNAADIFDVPAAARIKEREVIVPVATYYQSIVDTTLDLLKHLEALAKEYSEVEPSFVDEMMRTFAKQLFLSKSVLTNEQTKKRAIELMTEVGIPEPERRFYQYPFEFSGGMRQRIVIAIALSGDPKILICDEPTTALDVTIQAQILELINKLKVEKNLSIIFITHDLGVVANMANDIAVMYAGKIVEYGSVYDIFYDPRHPYTWALLGSMPDLETKGKLDAIPGTPPNMLLPPRGDAFAARNQYALAIDYEQEPPFFQISDTHFAKTWLLHEGAPDVEAPHTVIARIANSLSENPVNIPSYKLAKNSILAGLNISKGGKKRGK